MKKSRRSSAATLAFQSLGPLFICAIVATTLSILICTSPRQMHVNSEMQSGIGSAKF